jgi:hypothetical protein
MRGKGGGPREMDLGVLGLGQRNLAPTYFTFFIPRAGHH